MYGLRRGFGASPSVQQIAQAIAHAEGYYTPSGSINVGAAPVRNNNPCDLTSGGALAAYPDIGTGWQKCYNQIGAITGDTSSVYSSDMSISEIASHWAPAPSAACGAMCAGNVPSNWAATVAGQLGLSPSDTLLADSGVFSPATQSDDVSATSPLDLASGALLPSSFSLTDDSGNLSPVGWGLLAATVAGLVIAVAS